MRLRLHRVTLRRSRGRILRAGGATLALWLLPLGFCAGCSEEVSAQFRAAAIESVRDGFKSIAAGLLDGLFAIAEPDTDTTGGT